jgi:hypothetical protein
MKDKIEILLLKRKLARKEELIEELTGSVEHWKGIYKKLWQERLLASDEIRTQLDVIRNEMIALEIKRETS